ncbi:hypothetical protein [Streptomyces sp. NPDC058989]
MTAKTKDSDKGSTKDLRAKTAEENRKSSYGTNAGKNTGRKW